MRIALIGYGKMGQEVERLSRDRGDEPPVIFEEAQPLQQESQLESVQVAIDFSTAEAVLSNAECCVRAGVPIVIGTTGWQSQLNRLQQIVESFNGACVHGANFSIGVNIFYRIVERAGRLLNAAPEYDVALSETHHVKKRDSPSGTALRLAKILTTTVTRKETSVAAEPNRIYSANELVISSERVGSVPGTHTVLFDSTADSIELTHRARSRSGFALGALIAGDWIVGRKGFFSVEQFTDSLLTERGV